MATSTFWCVFEKLCERANKRPNPVGKEIGVASGTIAKWKAGTIPNGETLIQIADYFNVTIDYLLGRADTPKENMNGNNGILINGSVNGNHSKLTVASPAHDEMSQELLNGFQTLKFEDKMKIMNLLIELKK